ncbi:beta-glucosidase [Enterovirga aerilata]|uniref:Beta-glucosidase n=1 Tax=Enterovirga aerilata TaxID=2730920 RepID=A0A849IA88_9HYPH|nr:beta-glucosidase [Enterovirga sp. DB1703]NNM73185.1 beta-glucosidase [Enterovirga sp. DB1703]
MGIFQSFFLGGFECSTQIRRDGRRLDLLRSTGHDRFALQDYRALAEHGIAAVRDGLRWHLIEKAPGVYDWDSFLPMLQAAEEAGVQVIWDLCHYGWPEDIDIWSDAFPARLAAYAAAAAEVIVRETGRPPLLCPVNEISFWAWAGGEVGRFGPNRTGEGARLKRQLVRAALAATRAVREAVPGARFVCAEPLIHVEPALHDAPDHVAGAEGHRNSQFEAVDLMLGRAEPELGGGPDCLDLVGVNFYPFNQWYHGGSTIPLGHHAFRPLRDMLLEVWERYSRPMFIAETGAEGSGRASWLHYVCGEVRAAMAAGVPLEGVCLYPILDYHGWDNDRLCATGLLSSPDASGRRRVHEPLAEELRAQRARLEAARVTAPGLDAAA